MKAVILAGGTGSRILEESSIRPKPMIEIGGLPILWHIMKIYSSHGINDFVICLGYKGYQIKEYFAHYVLHQSNITVDIAHNSIEYHQSRSEPWRVTLVDTGESTATGGRLARIRPYLTSGESFCMTYGDGVADINIPALIDFHRQEKRLATVTAVSPPGRFGALVTKGTGVTAFSEKPAGDGAMINGGFFVLEPAVIDRIAGDTTAWEGAPLEGLAQDGQLSAFTHNGFWHPMDTMRDKKYLEDLWSGGTAPWKKW